MFGLLISTTFRVVHDARSHLRRVERTLPADKLPQNFRCERFSSLRSRLRRQLRSQLRLTDAVEQHQLAQLESLLMHLVVVVVASVCIVFWKLLR